ncbi:MAG: hypothetical protein KF745_02900 [Phycisphaeraceae bacterium]|nr:hypothetical protein [Phycisphaeraceae bacterium]
MTKFLIVASAVLCLLLAALTVAYSANADRIIGSVESERAQRQRAEASASQQIAETADVRAMMAKDLEAANNANSALKAQIEQLQSAFAAQQAEKEKAVSDATAIRAQIGQLSATTDTQAGLIRSYREEVTTLRTEQQTMSRQAIDLVDRINDLQSQREVLEQTARALREQLAEVQLAMQNVQSGNRGDTRGQPFESTGPLIRGMVTDVVQSPAGDELVVIDVGSNKGVQENMKMAIVRGSSFVANLVITKADPGQSIGRVDKVGRDVSVSRGDGVQSKLQ